MGYLIKLLEGVESPYYGKIATDAEHGEIIIPDDNEHPHLRIVDSEVKEIKSLNVQVVKLVDPETGETAMLRRIVADIGDGMEIDIVDPIAMNADIVELGIDTSKCAACMMSLDGYDLRFHEGKAYHRYCIDGGGAANGNG